MTTGENEPGVPLAFSKPFPSAVGGRSNDILACHHPAYDSFLLRDFASCRAGSFDRDPVPVLSLACKFVGFRWSGNNWRLR